MSSASSSNQPTTAPSLDPWDARKEAVCRLVFAKGSGSGFHYGNGWIVTNSHVVGPDAGNVPSMVVHFTNGRVNLVVPARPRRCYFIDIDYKSGEADFQHADVAMFQLTDDEMRVSTAVHGVDQLPSMTHASVGAVRLTEPAPVQVGDYLRCLHHGGGSVPVLDSMNEQVLRILDPVITKVDIAVGHNPSRTVLRRVVNTASGSSGAPVFDATSGLLVGVHFSGSPEIACAVCFSPTVRQFLSNNILLIASCGRLDDFHRLAASSNMNFDDRIQQQIVEIRGALPPHMRIEPL